MVRESIETVAGTAYYVKTEVENAQGRWNDNYYTRDGYYVIHEGKQHHVYKVRSQGRGWHEEKDPLLGKARKHSEVQAGRKLGNVLRTSEVKKKMSDKQEERQKSIETLRSWLKKDDTVFTILRNESPSGMTRRISLLFFSEKDQPRYLSYHVARILGLKDKEREGSVVVSGGGMDMGFHLVYETSRVIFGDGYALTHRWL